MTTGPSSHAIRISSAENNSTENGSPAPLLPAATALNLDNLINPQYSLAPGVELDNFRTWLKTSRFTESDYSPNEGIPNWDDASKSPGTVQKIRAYLIKPTPNQVREGDKTDVEEMSRLIRNFAINGQDEPLKCSAAENGLLQISNGHRRYCAGVNADAKFFDVKLYMTPADSLLHLRQMIVGNEFRKQLNPNQRAKQFIAYLKELQNELGAELSAEQAISVLASEFNVGQEEALDLLTLTRAHSLVRNGVEWEVITVQDAIQIVNHNPSPESQVPVFESFVKALPDDKTIKRISGKTRKDGTGTKGRKPTFALKDEFDIQIPGTSDSINVSIKSTNERTKVEIRAALEEVLKQYGLNV